MSRPVIVGAVVYDPKVVVIWEIIQKFFEDQGVPMDTVFFTNYELQNDALAAGQLDIAWNSPLAWLDAEHIMPGKTRAIAMRDTDRDRRSHILVRADSDVQAIADLAGRKIAVGAKDSPQATLIPLNLLAANGIVEGQNLEVERFNLLVGKHGDHVGGELEALKALESGDAEASTLLDLNYIGWTAEGKLRPEKFRVLATTDPFDHCVFATGPSLSAELEKPWLETLMKMDYANPDHKEMMDMEGLKEWLPGRTSGFDQLSQAIGRYGFPNR